MAEPSRERDQAIKKVLEEIEKGAGKGAIMRLGEGTHQDIQGISTGSLALDIALGGKGLPRGRIIEIFGAESSGKTTIALHAVANAQRAGGVAAYIDAEHALDPSWARRVGVDLENLLVSQPDHAEQALRIAEMLIKSNAVDLIVIDSVAALVPSAEVAGEIGDSHVGLLARLMSQALRILTPKIAASKTCMIFINQIRQKVGQTYGYGPQETTSGGLALKFYASVRLEVKRAQQIKKGEDTIGNDVKVKVVKNKVAPPFRTAEFQLMYEGGISREGDIIAMGVEDKLIDKKGNWLYYGEVGLGNGMDKAKEFLRENQALAEEIVRKILEKRGLTAMLMPVESADGEEAEEAPAPEPAPTRPTRSRRSASASTTTTPAE